MNYDKGINRDLLIITALILVLSCSFPLVSDAQQPTLPERAGDPAANTVTAPEKKDAPACQAERASRGEKSADYDSCSPVFPGAEIAHMMTCAKALSPGLPGKLRPILLKCDLDVNNRLLEFIETVPQEVPGLEFRNEDQERDFFAEKPRRSSCS